MSYCYPSSSCCRFAAAGCRLPLPNSSGFPGLHASRRGCLRGTLLAVSTASAVGLTYNFVRYLLGLPPGRLVTFSTGHWERFVCYAVGLLVAFSGCLVPSTAVLLSLLGDVVLVVALSSCLASFAGSSLVTVLLPVSHEGWRLHSSPGALPGVPPRLGFCCCSPRFMCAARAGCVVLCSLLGLGRHQWLCRLAAFNG